MSLPVDFGLILGSTNDDIWNEEVNKDAGARALRKALFCDGARGCPLNARQHLQCMFDDPDILQRAAEFMAPFEGEAKEALLERLKAVWPSLVDEDDDDGMPDGALIGVTMREDGGYDFLSPDGSIMDMSDMPEPLQQMLGQLIQSFHEGDDPEPGTPPSRLH